MMYRLDIESPQGTANFEIFATSLESAERTAVAEALGADFGGACSLTLRAPHSPDLVRRCDSPKGEWYWLRAGERLPADTVFDGKTHAAWGHFKTWSPKC